MTVLFGLSAKKSGLTRRSALRGLGTGAVVGTLTACGARAPIRPARSEITVPFDPDADLAPNLVDLAQFDPRLRFDIRYATANNFMGRVLYPQARALAQKPVAEALSRVQNRAEASGFGLLIFDAYRPWRVTRMMWDETPVDQRDYVADPRKGSRHNRGCSIDLSLHRAGKEVKMPSDYDDFTAAAWRSNTDAPAEALAASRMLESWMVAEGFEPLANEWWHYDWHEWQRYPIMDVPLDEMSLDQPRR